MSGPLVRAVLAGQKTQTRRPIKRENKPDPGFEWAECLCREIDPSDTPCATCAARFPGLPSAGDKLWVRETFAIVHGCRDMDTGYIDDWMVPRDLPKDDDHGFWTVLYRADDRFDESKEDRGFSWRPMIHMPRWACRLVLPLVSVRVERVQSITETDARAEGLRRTENGWTDGATGYDVTSARAAFQELWASIYGQEAWDSNPWVWVAEWKEIEVSK
jgi:hypothetical protein